MPIATLSRPDRRTAIRCAFALAGMLALAACTPPAKVDADDYAVWSAAIRTLMPRVEELISVDAHTAPGELHERLTDGSWWAERDYNQRNRVRTAIDPTRLSVANVRILPDDSASIAARHASGEIFHAPWISLSRPGYGLTHQTAVVTITASCGSLCGGGETMLLVRGDDGRWRKQATLEVIFF